MTPEVMTETLKHNLSLGEDFLHDDFDHEHCQCGKLSGFVVQKLITLPMVRSKGGNSCATCGGINMLPTGSCETCMDCGTSGGCS